MEKHTGVDWHDHHFGVTAEGTAQRGTLGDSHEPKVAAALLRTLHPELREMMVEVFREQHVPLGRGEWAKG